MLVTSYKLLTNIHANSVPLYARHTHSRPFYVFLYHIEDRRPLTHPVHIKSP